MELDLKTQFQFYIGTFERELYPWITRLSDGIRSAIDIGAADGEYTLYFSKRSDATHLFTFEPSLEMISRVRVNLSLNGVDETKITISNKFVGDRSEPNFCSLDSFQANLELPCLIKIDVDGGEVDVLQSASALMDRSAVRFLIETHSPSLEERCIQLLKRAGFDTRVVCPAWWRCILPEQRVDEHNQWLVAAKPEDISL